MILPVDFWDTVFNVMHQLRLCAALYAQAVDKTKPDPPNQAMSNAVNTLLAFLK